MLDDWGLVESKISRVVRSSGAVTCDKCRKYIFKKEGRYYLSYDGYPKIENLPVLIVKPEVKGVVHTTIYPEKKVEERNLFTLRTTGVGNHWIQIKIGNYKKEFVIPEGSELKGNVILDFNNNKLKIKYFLDNQVVGTDVVMSLSSCLHKDCSIPYEIWYDDAYGFRTYQPTLFARSSIDIRWNNLDITLEKTTLKDKNPSTLKINVRNEGPVRASEIKIRNLKYNNRCLDIQNPGNVLGLEPNQMEILNLNIRIKDYYCSNEDYKISFDVYGWNTYIYPFSIYVPVSYISFPEEGSVLSDIVTFNIIDKNADICTISFGDEIMERRCDSSFVYDNYCKETGTCVVNITSENDFLKYIDTYYYMIPYEVSGALYAVVSPKTLYFPLGSEKELLVTIKNGREDATTCEYSIESNLLAVSKVEIDGDTLIGNEFTIPGKNSIVIVYTLVGLKNGLENLKITVSCDSGDSLTIKVPVVVGQFSGANVQPSGENVVYNDDKISWALLIPAVAILFLLI